MTKEHNHDHDHDHEHEEDFGQVVVSEVIDVMESILKEERSEEFFEFSDDNLREGMKRFSELYKTDRWTAIAGMMMSSMVTTDVFYQVMEGDEDSESEEK